MVKIAFFKESLEIPKGIDIEVDDNNRVKIKGPNGGPITKNFSHARGIKISVNGNKINFSTNFPKRNVLALAKTIINIINNLIIGVQTNYKYVCKICSSHFPCSVRVDEEDRMLYVENFLGERAPRKTKFEENIKVEVNEDDVTLISFDKEALGQTAANLKRCCRIRKKDPRVFQDGVYLYKIMLGDKILWQIK
ncbi:MAG: 50S ribosomal protein L6 [Promethearchaeota archaeon]